MNSRPSTQHGQMLRGQTPTVTVSTFGELVRTYRRHYFPCIDQKAFARRAGVHRNTLINAERSHRSTQPETYAAIRKVFQTKLRRVDLDRLDEAWAAHRAQHSRPARASDSQLENRDVPTPPLAVKVILEQAVRNVLLSDSLIQDVEERLRAEILRSLESLADPPAWAPRDSGEEQ